jgi:hypothetical protein
MRLSSSGLGAIWATLILLGVTDPAHAQSNYRGQGEGRSGGGGFDFGALGGLIQGAETAIGNAIANEYQQNNQGGMFNNTPN